MRRRVTCSIAVWLLVAAMLIAWRPASAEAKVNRVALVPFSLNAPGDLAYLIQGVQDMLTSRLASAEIELVDPAEVELAAAKLKRPLTAKAAAKVAERTKADFVVFGSVTKLGPRYSLNWQVLKAAEPAKPTGIARTASEDKLIDTVDEMALLVREVISGKPPTALVARGPAASAAAPAAPSPARKKEAKKPTNVFTQAGESSTSEDEALLTTFKAQKQAVGLFNIKPISPAPLTMCVGDVDGDGSDEVLILNTESLAIYKWKNGSLLQHVRIPKPMKGRMIMISAGDVNGDGRAEIAMTALYGQLPTASLFKFDDNRLIEMDTLSRYHLRIIQSPKGPILVGQQALLDVLFFGDFIRYSLVGGKLKPSGKIMGQRHIEFPTLVLADLDGDQRAEGVGLDDEEKLTVVNAAGKVLYRSESYFGGTNNFLQPDREGGDVNETGYFINSGLSLADVDGDGQREIIAVSNEDVTRRYTMQMRHYRKGSVYALSWSGGILTPKFRTPQVPQYLAGAGVMKLEGGQKMLVMVGSEPVTFGGLLNIFNKIKGFTFTAPVSTGE